MSMPEQEKNLIAFTGLGVFIILAFFMFVNLPDKIISCDSSKTLAENYKGLFFPVQVQEANEHFTASIQRNLKDARTYFSEDCIVFIVAFYVLCACFMIMADIWKAEKYCQIREFCYAVTAMATFAAIVAYSGTYFYLGWCIT
jgi:hypothetical protein